MYYAILAILALGALCVAFFIALFVGGAVVGLGSLGRQALRAQARTQDVTASVPVARPAARPAGPREAAKAASAVGAGAACAPA